MTTSPTEYDPEYVDVSDVPLEIPDEYDKSDKKEALYQAEARFEMERNAGVELEDPERITPLHKSAVANLATYHLARSATNNSDVTLGDLDDGGEQTERHAEQFLETYHEHVDLISEAGTDGNPGIYIGATGRAGKGSTVTVNHGADNLRHNLRDQFSELVHDRFTKSKDDL